MSGRGRPWWAALLLRLYPPDFRASRAGEVDEFLTHELRRARDRSAGAYVATCLRLAADLALGGLRLRLRPATGSPGAGFLHDLRHAARGLVKRPLVPAVVVLTIGLGVGLNTALFSVVHRVLLRPLDYAEPDRLVLVSARVRMGDVERVYLTGGDLQDLRSVAAFQAVEGATSIFQNLSGQGHPRQVNVGWTSGGFFQLLGVEAALGRVYTPDDPRGTVVLAHDFWRDHFAGSVDVLGGAVRLDGHPHTVVGVLPPGFRPDLPRFGGEEIDLWKNPDDFWQNGDLWGFQGPEYAGIVEAVARLKPTVTVADADARLAELTDAWTARWPVWEERGLTLDAEPLQREVVGDVRSPLLLLMAAVAAVLLIACANVMGILLVRVVRRRREVALRAALGASRRRILRWLLGESLLLCLAGGAVGLLLGVAGVEAFGRWGPPLPRADDVRLHPAVLAFALLLSLACTVLVGLVPAIGASRVGGLSALAGRRTSSERGQGLRSALVVMQIAVSLVLLVGAGLLGSTLVRLMDVEPGFDPEGLVTFAVSLPGARYAWPVETGRFLREMEERMESRPGVEEAGVGWPMPLSDTRWISVYGAPGSALDGQEPMGDYRVVSPGYFSTLGIPFVEGRTFEASDPRRSVIVSERIARAAWPEGGSHVLVRTDRSASDIVPELRSILAEMDPEVPLATPAPMAELVDAQLASSRAALGVVGLFSVVAGGLAVLGLYGVMAYSAGLRSRELAIRLALGAARGEAVRLVLRQGLRLTLLGLVLGLAGAGMASRALQTWLFGVDSTDPATYLLAAGVLGATAVAAAWLPARRAARLAPMEVLQAE